MHELILKPSHMTVPVGKMLCLGRNYAKHAREMGSEVGDAPVVFLKPSTALVRSGGHVVRPSISSELHHELELVVVVDRTVREVSPEEAMDVVLGYAIGLDMTLRDVQALAKQRGEPWTLAKAFDTSAPISEVARRDLVDDPHELEMTLHVNGELRQRGFTGDMVMRIPETISYLSRFFTLERGDCIFTGTPEGVGPVGPGDRLLAEIPGLVALEVDVVERVVAQPA